MKRDNKFIDNIRRRSTDIENQLIDEFAAGYIGRREFLRHGTVLGMSMPLLTMLGSAFGLSAAISTPAVAAKIGGTLRIAAAVETGAIDPLTVADGAGLLMLQQTGEFLCNSGSDLQLRPVLAESWKPSTDGLIWTFKLRHGVKFHNGKDMRPTTWSRLSIDLPIHRMRPTRFRRLAVFSRRVEREKLMITRSSFI